eukprot:765641-Rhodomonas_salina.2
MYHCQPTSNLHGTMSRGNCCWNLTILGASVACRCEGVDSREKLTEPRKESSFKRKPMCWGVANALRNQEWLT